MKHNIVVILFVLLCFAFAKAQKASRDYRIDSLQFKMYTRIYVGKQLQLDSIVVRKVFCNWCSPFQTKILEEEALRQSYIERNNPKYKKPGQHRLALYVRFSKEDFKNLENTDG